VAKGLAILQVSDICRRRGPLSKFHGSDDATALVGMPELVIGAQVLRDGEWWLLVERPERIGRGARAVVYERLDTADRVRWCGICRLRGHRRCWCSPAAGGVAVRSCVRFARGLSVSG
jgi:hypothetical protein